MEENHERKTYRYPLDYNGSLVWPILFLFLFPPLGLLLVILNTRIRKGQTLYYLSYRGDHFWLYFWTIVFFPIAIILAILNGFDGLEATELD